MVRGIGALVREMAAARWKEKKVSKDVHYMKAVGVLFCYPCSLAYWQVHTRFKSSVYNTIVAENRGFTPKFFKCLQNTLIELNSLLVL